MRVDARSAGGASAASAAAPGQVDTGSTAQVVVGGAALPAQCVPCAPSAIYPPRAERGARALVANRREPILPRTGVFA